MIMGWHFSMNLMASSYPTSSLARSSVAQAKAWCSLEIITGVSGSISSAIQYVTRFGLPCTVYCKGEKENIKSGNGMNGPAPVRPGGGAFL